MPSSLAVLSDVTFMIGSACNLAGMVPQFVRTSVRGRIDGLAPAALAMSLSINLLWLGYGLALANHNLVLLQVLALLVVGTNATRFWQISGGGPRLCQLARRVAAAAATIAVVVATGQVWLLTLAGTATNLLGALPQMLHLRQLTPGASTAGVAAASLLLGLTGSVNWVVYWALEGNWPVALGIGGNIITVGVTLLLLTRLRCAERRLHPTT